MDSQTQKQKTFIHTVYKRAKQYPVEENITECPQCGTRINEDYGHGEEYCPACGLITRSSIPYVGLTLVDYPYGLLL